MWPTDPVKPSVMAARRILPVRPRRARVAIIANTSVRFALPTREWAIGYRTFRMTKFTERAQSEKGYPARLKPIRFLFG